MTSIRGSEHLLLHHRNRIADSRALQRAAQDGGLIRLRSGAFVPAAVWNGLTAAERRRLETAAAAEKHASYVASHRSAAALWRIPTIRPHDGLVHARVSSAAGSRIEHGVRKHAVRDEAMHLMRLHGIACTTLERTVLDLVATEPFEEAVVAADCALRSSVTKDRLRSALEEWRPVRGRRRIEVVLEFADGASGSPGESWSRVQIAEAGLPAPILQQGFFDEDGLAGYVDFWWPEHRLIGEFDGLKKYREPALLQGRDAGAVVAAEKVREDRLRATRGSPGMSRWFWADLMNRSLGRRLQRAGLPLLR